MSIIRWSLNNSNIYFRGFKEHLNKAFISRYFQTRSNINPIFVSNNILSLFTVGLISNFNMLVKFNMLAELLS